MDFFKRLSAALALAFAVCFAVAAPRVVTGNITTQNLVAAGDATASSAVEMDVAGVGTVTAQVTGTYTGALSGQVTTDGATWVTLGATSTFTRLSAGTTSATITSGQTDIYQISAIVGAKRFRVTGLAAMTGTATVTIQTVELSVGSSSGGAGGASTIADGADSTTGSKTDAACAGDSTSGCSVEARLIRIAQNLTTVDGHITASNAQLPTGMGQTNNAGSSPVVISNQQMTATANADANRLPVSADIASPVTGTAAAAAVLSNMPFAVGKGTKSVIVNLTANSATANFEWSTDGVVAYASGQCWLKTNSGNAGSVTTSTSASTYVCPVEGTHFQVRQSGAGGVTATVAPSAREVQQAMAVNVGGGSITAAGAAAVGASASGNPLPLAVVGRTAQPTAVTTGQVQQLWGTLGGVLLNKPYSIPELDWNYAAATSGILNTTTAVTIQAAQAAGIRNYVTAIDLMCEALGTATEVAVRDGAGGTVLWRTKVGTGGLTAGRHIVFPNPLKGTAATLMEVVTLTASGTGACYFNASGFGAY